MKIYSAAECPAGSPNWWTVRRGKVTASNADMILTPKTCKPSAQQSRLIAMLVADIVNPSPNWFSERGGKPPNKAIEDGIAREAESRRWYAFTHDVDVQEVGFILADDGVTGCSPDGLIGADGLLELKNPTLDTQAGYLADGGLEDDYRCQCHMQMIVTGRQWVELLSYCPPLDPVTVQVVPGPFTEALRAELALFLEKFAEVKRRLGIPDVVTDEGEILQ